MINRWFRIRLKFSLRQRFITSSGTISWSQIFPKFLVAPPTWKPWRTVKGLLTLGGIRMPSGSRELWVEPMKFASHRSRQISLAYNRLTMVSSMQLKYAKCKINDLKFILRSMTRFFNKKSVLDDPIGLMILLISNFIEMHLIDFQGWERFLFKGHISELLFPTGEPRPGHATLALLVSFRLFEIRAWDTNQ